MSNKLRNRKRMRAIRWFEHYEDIHKGKRVHYRWSPTLFKQMGFRENQSDSRRLAQTKREYRQVLKVSENRS